MSTTENTQPEMVQNEWKWEQLELVFYYCQLYLQFMCDERPEIGIDSREMFRALTNAKHTIDLNCERKLILRWTPVNFIIGRYTEKKVRNEMT